MNWIKKLFKKKDNQPKSTQSIPSNDGPIATPWLDIARAELGVKEIPGSKHEKRILEYHKATSLESTEDEVPWCSSFVSWCLEKAGVPSTRNAWARSYLAWGTKIDKPVLGCIVVFSRGASSGHVAFYVGESDAGIQCLGGNQSNKVCLATYPKSRLLGYRLPKIK
jgi:uncharacterized protein (TIGR02594 family)